MHYWERASGRAASRPGLMHRGVVVASDYYDRDRRLLSGMMNEHPGMCNTMPFNIKEAYLVDMQHMYQSDFANHHLDILTLHVWHVYLHCGWLKRYHCM